MATALDPRTQPLSTQDAIDAVWESVMDGTYKGVAEAARALWPSLLIDSVSRDVMALEGLISLSFQAKGHLVRSGRKPLPWGAPPGKKFERYIALTWPFEAADGSQKPLLQFSRSDLAAFALRAGKLQAAWAERREWAIAADRMLNEHGAATIDRLPAEALKDLSDRAASVFGGET